ncbi:MAG: hypothetical protein FJ030_01850 [Chloroflexi bacterium]|nr:hypothetical protein [Chloroflexota bacterium]
MSRPINLGTWFGLKFTISLWSIVSYLATALALALVSGLWLALSANDALLAGALSAVMMFLCENLHQWGHSRAARRLGHPMIGVHHFSLFSFCVYPPDEPPLPPSVHIRRALGGFWINLLIGLLLVPASITLWPTGGAIGWLTAFTAFWNGAVLGLGALLPIDIPGVFTIDGGTILRCWREMKRRGA